MKKTVSPQLRRAFSAFLDVVGIVEAAKDALVAAVPKGRRAAVPMAEALWAFESGIADARARMVGWRTAETEDVWATCVSAVDQSAAAAEALRVGEAPEGYEELYARLADLLEPLDSLAAAGRRFRELGC